jgi:hypothetical protein
MDDLEPGADPSQWLWFGAALVAFMMIAYIAMLFP